MYMSYGQNLVHGEGTSLSRVGPYRFCSGGTLYKPSWGYRFGYRFRVGPYRFCSDGNPTTLSILLWSYLILSDIHMINLGGVAEIKVLYSRTFFGGEPPWPFAWSSQKQHVWRCEVATSRCDLRNGGEEEFCGIVEPAAKPFATSLHDLRHGEYLL